MKGAASQTWSIDRSASEPIIQYTISIAAKGLGDRFKTRLVKAAAKAEIATPARISAKAPPRGPARPRIKSTATPAPAKADSGKASANSVARPVCSASTAPSAALADTPINPGSAKGLRR